MIQMILQKTATSELWWIGSALALIFTAWLALILYQFLRKKLTHHGDGMSQPGVLKH